MRTIPLVLVALLLITARVATGAAVPISGLPNAPLLLPTDFSTVVHAGVTYQAPISQIVGAAGNVTDLSTAQTVAGVKTFSSAPVMSGASITNGTVANTALVTSPLTGLTAGANIAVGTGTTPSVAVAGVLPIANGGTGSATASLAAGTNVTISGVFPNQTINAVGTGTGAAGVTSVSASGNIASSGGATPIITFIGTLPVANGGTGTTTPAIVAGTGVTVTGTWPNQTIASSGAVSMQFDPKKFGALEDGTTDDTAALNSAIASANTSGGGFIPITGTLLALGAIVFPYTAAAYPRMSPIHIGPNPLAGNSGNGGWDGSLVAPTITGGSVLDLRYNGVDGVHNAKIDARGFGLVEIDHITIKDGGTDSFPFIVTTNTTLDIHHVSFYGNTANSGKLATQDAIIVGENGYVAAAASTTAGSTTVNIGAGDPPFQASYVGYNISVVGGSTTGPQGFYSGTIATVVSATQVTVNTAPTATIANAAAYYFNNYNNDKNAAYGGYGTKIHENHYSYIRRLVTLNQYANSVKIEDEDSDFTCGASDALGAAYVLGGTPGYNNAVWGTIIRGSTIEVPYYKYAVAVTAGDNNNTLDALQAWDANGYFIAMLHTTAGLGYGVPKFNSITNPYVDNSPITYVDGPLAAFQTINSGQFGGVNTFLNPVTAPSLQPNGPAGGYAPEVFVNGKPVHPQIVAFETQINTIAGTLVAFPNAFAFPNTNYYCSVTQDAGGTNPTVVGWTRANSTTSAISLIASVAGAYVSVICME